MNVWNQFLLSLYYYGTLPARRRRNAREARAGRAPVMVLFYHRIADEAPNDWTASRRTFARQLRWLKQNFDLVSLEEAQRRIRSGCNERAAVSITFDDGYADNCRFALPLLIDEQIPVTYFVASDHVLYRTPFPHDLVLGRPLTPNTAGQLRRLAEQGVEIGAHTRTHADLGRVYAHELLWDELAGSKEAIEQMTGKPVRYFAFPYGQHANLSIQAFQAARKCGFEGVCSAYGGYNFPGDDAFHLQRIHADNDLIRLKNWLTVDPRKLKKSRRFEYHDLREPLLAGAVEA